MRLIDQSRTFGSLTIGKLDSPQIFGVEQFLRITTSTEVRCATKCTYALLDPLRISKEHQHQSQTILTSRINPSESIYIFSAISSAYPRAVQEWKTFEDVLRSTNILQNQVAANCADTIVYLDKARDGFIYGQIITSEICSTFFIDEEWPRIACIKLVHKSELGERIETDKSASDTPTLERMIKPISLDQNEEISGEDQEINQQEHDGFRVIRAETQQESFASCLSMLATFYQLPTRRDTISRAAGILASVKPRKQIENSKPSQQQPWMTRMLAILDELGLAVRWITVNPKQPFRIPTPSVWVDQVGNPILLTRSTGKKLFVIDRGRKAFTKQPRQSKNSHHNPSSFQLKLVYIHPKNNSDFIAIPYIKRYRIQLIEVFSASFLNQIFALATPLLFQQIIDRVISKGAFDALAPLVVLMLIFVILKLFLVLYEHSNLSKYPTVVISIGASIVSRLLAINAFFRQTSRW